MSTDNQERDYVFSGDKNLEEILAERSATAEAAFLLPFLSPAMSLVDVGCGLGSITVGFGKALSEGSVTGFDTQAEHIERATQLAKDEGAANVSFREGDLLASPFPESSFDVAYANAVIQHLSDPDAGIAAMKDLVKPGGLVAIRDRGGHVVAGGLDREVLDRVFDIVAQTIDSISGNPYGTQVMGEILNRLCREAGLEVLSMSASWNFLPAAVLRNVVGGQFAERGIQLRITFKEEMDDLLARLEAWDAEPDAYFAYPWFEVVARKP